MCIYLYLCYKFQSIVEVEPDLASHIWPPHHEAAYVTTGTGLVLSPAHCYSHCKSHIMHPC